MLQPVLEQLLAKKPEHRFATAQQFIDALRGVFLTHEALRRQVGFSGTSMAWSSQLRALGFVLDPVQKDEVRRAQGDFLQTRSAPQAVEAPRPRTVALPPPAMATPQATPPLVPASQQAPAKSRTGLWLAVIAGLVLVGAGLYWPRTLQPTTATSPAAASASQARASDVLAARESYGRAADRLQQFATKEQRDVKLTLESAAEFAAQGVAALDEQRIDAALQAYRNALDIIDRDGAALLTSIEQGHARTAQTMPKAGRLEEAKTLLERAKQARELRVAWAGK